MSFGNLSRKKKLVDVVRTYLIQLMNIVADRVFVWSRTLFVGKKGLEEAKQAIISYKTGQTKEMTPAIWTAKKIVDSTLHPGMR